MKELCERNWVIIYSGRVAAAAAASVDNGTRRRNILAESPLGVGESSLAYTGNKMTDRRGPFHIY